MSIMKSGSDNQSEKPLFDVSLAFKMMDAHFRYSRQISQLASFLSASGEYSILYSLYSGNQDLSAGDLAESMGLSSGRTANLLKALEKKGYISRSRDASDARRILVSLTQKGREFVCKLFHQTQEIYGSLVEALGEKDTLDFIRITEKLLELAKNAE